jgi:hypothetical protein
MLFATLLDEAIERELKYLSNQKIIVDEMPQLFRAPFLIIAHERRGIELHLEAQHLRAQLFVDGIARQVAAAVARDHLLDLSNVLILSGIEPCLLRLGRHDASQLARARERQRTLFECRLDGWQFFNSLRHAKSLDRRARGVPELALHIVDEARVPKLLPESNPLRFAKGSGLLRIEKSPGLGDSFQCPMDAFAMPADRALVRCLARA